MRALRREFPTYTRDEQAQCVYSLVTAWGAEWALEYFGIEAERLQTLYAEGAAIVDAQRREDERLRIEAKQRQRDLLAAMEVERKRRQRNARRRQREAARRQAIAQAVAEKQRLSTKAIN
jgi:hypothetical protein